jgi:hypothetical protein
VKHAERELPAKKEAAEKIAVGPSGRALLPGINARKNVIEFEAAPAKFVRMTIAKTNTGSEPCIDELEVFNSGGENLALASGGAKATASSEYPNNPVHRIKHLNDGKRGNSFSWISNESNTGWVMIELPRVEAVSRIVWGRDGEENPKYTDRVAVKYVIEVSEDGQAWKKIVGDADHAERREGKRAYIGTFGEPEVVHRLARGNVMRPMEPMGPAGLTGVGMSADLKLSANASEGERRLALARWICDEKNPLTARVMVNRVWQYHFGRGIVNTPSDFGLAGEAPSHPELLDWLAGEFVRNGWRIKPLHRMIMLSSTYRQNGVRVEGNAKIDGGNVYLWHMPPKRLEAEAIRDSILATSGKLDLKMGGPGFRLFKYRVVNVAIYEPLEKHGPETWRRSVYHQWPRGIREDLLASFDFPETAGRSPRRDMTTNALQALTMLNSVFVVDQASYFAERVRGESGDDVAKQVERVFVVSLGRKPSEGERAAAEALVRRHGLEVLCRGVFNLNEFLTY